MFDRNIYSNFITNSQIRPSIIYVKHRNSTCVEIDINEDWTMLGTSKSTKIQDMGYNGIMSDAQCKHFLSTRVAPNRGKFMLDELGLKEYDTMEILYRTRGIQPKDDWWLAWSEDDKAEDYHPNFNKEIAEKHYRVYSGD